MDEGQPQGAGPLNYLDAEQLADRLPPVITKRWIQEYTRKGVIPVIKVGRKYLYDPVAVDAALRSL